MIITVVTPPDPLVTLEMAKEHLKADLESTDEDALIKAYIDAACAHLDGPQGWLGRSVGQQSLRLEMPAFEGRNFLLPYPATLSVESLKYLDTDNVLQTIDPANYSLGNSRIWFAYGYTIPSVYSAHDAVQVEYTAGYEATPAALIAAVLLHVGTLYQNRESIGDGLVVLPHAYEALCAPYKVWHV